MTSGKRYKNERRTYEIEGALVSLLILLSVLFVTLCLSTKTQEYVKGGLRLCAMSVVPAVFPFFILSDFYFCVGSPERIKPLAKLFSTLFGLPKEALRAFVCGALCGFPTGVKATAELYRGSAISKKGAQRLLAISNLPSPPFVIAAVGAGMLGDIRLGFLLFFSVLTSAVVTGVIFRTNEEKPTKCQVFSGQKFSFVSSVKSAGVGTVTVCAFVTVFFVISGFAIDYIKCTPLLQLIISMLEISSASLYFSELALLGESLYAIIFSAFALGFGGLSVMLQGASFLSDTDLSLKGYLPIKLVEGVISGAVAALLYIMFFQ